MLFDVFAVPGLQTFHQCAAAAVADPVSIRLEYRRQFTHRAGREDFVRSAMDTFRGLDQRQIARSDEVGIPIPRSAYSTCAPSHFPIRQCALRGNLTKLGCNRTSAGFRLG